jgi:hypothetical protein
MYERFLWRWDELHSRPYVVDQGGRDNGNDGTLSHACPLRESSSRWEWALTEILCKNQKLSILSKETITFGSGGNVALGSLSPSEWATESAGSESGGGANTNCYTMRSSMPIPAYFRFTFRFRRYGTSGFFLWLLFAGLGGPSPTIIVSLHVTIN